ncbi:sugar ABC transporter substrate-binding protein [Chloroflexi bacterium TSY]|nr:sugar ABC transporter substrate-binding protein [Chloroflexi bacterium TSY]
MQLFAEAYPAIQAEYMPISDFSNKMKTMAAAHTLPDVFYLDSAMGPEWAALGATIPLDDYFDRDLNLEELGEDFLALSGEFQAQHWMLCNAQGPMGFYYNMDTFDEAGLDYPTADWTWDDMLEAALQLTKREDDRVERFGLSISRYPSFVFQNGGNYLDEARRTCTLDQPAAVEALQWVADLYSLHKVAPMPADLQLQPTTFQNGRIAMAWGDGPWSIGAGGYRDAEFRWDVVDVPRGKEKVVINYGSGMAVSSDTENADEAWAYAAFWLDYQPQVNFHSTWELYFLVKEKR